MNLAAPLIDKSNALECLDACQRVYVSPTLVTDECHVLLQEFDDFTHVTFRGSKSAEDWIHDFEFDKITIAGGKVHRGIWMSYMSMSTPLRARLNKAKPLFIDGHSLGGGHAEDCAWDLDGEFDIARVITFGCPRHADAVFRDNYNRSLGSKTIRFVDARDIVPRVPFEDMGYVHVGNEGFLPSAGGFELNPGFFELLHDDVVGGVEDLRSGKVELLADHHLEHYQARITALPTA